MSALRNVNLGLLECGHNRLTVDRRGGLDCTGPDCRIPVRETEGKSNMVISANGHRINLDTFEARACLDEIQRLQQTGGVKNRFCARLKGVELFWHCFNDAYAHGFELFTGIPHAYREGQLKKHSWHFVRAVTSATQAIVSLPLAMTPGLSLKVADTLGLRDSWEEEVSKDIAARVKETVVAMSKNPKAKSVLKIAVGLAAFGALAWVVGSYRVPVDVKPIVDPVQPPDFPLKTKLNELAAMLLDAGNSLTPKTKIAVGLGSALSMITTVGLAISCCCCGSSKKRKEIEADLKKPVPEPVPEPKVGGIQPEGSNVKGTQTEDVTTNPNDRVVNIGEQTYYVKNGVINIGGKLSNFHPAEDYLITGGTGQEKHYYKIQNYNNGLGIDVGDQWQTVYKYGSDFFTTEIVGPDIYNVGVCVGKTTIDGTSYSLSNVGNMYFATAEGKPTLRINPITGGPCIVLKDIPYLVATDGNVEAYIELEDKVKTRIGHDNNGNYFYLTDINNAD